MGMVSESKPGRRLVLVAALAVVSLVAVDGIGAAGPMAQKMIARAEAAPAAQSATDALPPEKLDAADAEALMSQMTDEQVRRLLLEKLRQEALEEARKPAAPVDPGLLTKFILWVQNSIVRLRDRVQFLLSGVMTAPGELPRSIADMTDGKGFGPFLIGFARVALAFLAAWLVNWFFRRRTAGAQHRIETTPGDADWRVKVARAVLRLVFDLTSIAIFIVVTLFIYFAFFEDNPLRRSFLLTYLTALSLVGLLGLLSRLILSPKAPALRLLPMDDDNAAYLHRWMIRIAVVGVFGWLTVGMLRNNRINEAFTFLLVVLVGLVIALMIVRMVLQKRDTVAGVLRQGSPENSLRVMIAGSWHVQVIAYVFIFWSFWVFSLLVLGDRAKLAGAATILVVPLFFLFDWLAGRLVHTALGMAKVREAAGGESPPADADAASGSAEHADDADAPEDALREVAEARKAAGMSSAAKKGKWRLDHTYRMLRRGFRIAIAALLFFWILGVWGIELPIARSVARSILKILLTVVLGYVVWEITNAFIERKLKGIQAGPEGGGAGGNRFRTLVQLARKFVLVVLITMVSLIVLSSMGIEIAPLLAGAGVVGLAIGFGSQALVKDIVSGVFFLMDDAFRIGDYIDTGSLKGVVEHISIRSLRLRHHRGMVHTIPFGDLKQVTNWTRDWVIMKLEFRVPFDTDVDQIRKIVKKIDQNISANPELGPKLLGKIKSQGVKEYDDSAMVMRVKFMTKPGEQFSIRKEVYKQLRERFAKAGIEFATRNVMVQIPPGAEMSDETRRAAAAAAQASVDAQAAAQKPAT